MNKKKLSDPFFPDPSLGPQITETKPASGGLHVEMDG